MFYNARAFNVAKNAPRFSWWLRMKQSMINY